MKKIMTAIFCAILAIVFTMEIFAATTNANICNGATYTWSGQIYTTAGTYISGTDTLVLAVNPLPKPTLTFAGSICDGNAGNDTLFFNFSETPATVIIKYNDSTLYSGIYYSFITSYPGSLSAGSYSLIATSQAGCSDSAFLTITAPCIDTNVIYKSICQGESVFFNNQWITNAGTYTDGSDTLILSVNPTPSINSLTQSGSVCQDGDTLTATINGVSHLQWLFSGNVVNTMIDTMTVAGGNGNGSAANQLYNPGGLFIDNSGYMYVVDYDNNRVQKFPPGSTSATNGITVAANGLNQPHTVFVDNNGDLYVSSFRRILKFPAGSTATTNGIVVAGGNGSGNAGNQLGDNPRGIFVDNSGYLYVVDHGNSRVQKFPPGSTSATNGVTIIANGNSLGQYPSDIFIDNIGNIYVTDYNNNRIQKFLPNSSSGMTIAGGNGSGSAANQLREPRGIFVDNNGNLYVADRMNHRIQKFPAGSTSATNGITILGPPPPPGGTLSFEDVFMDAQGNLYASVLSGSSKVLKISDNNNSHRYIASALGTYTLVAMNVKGCTDSMSVSVSPCGTAYQSICQGDSAYFNNQWIKQAGTYINLNDTLVLSVNFCSIDSGDVWPGDANHNGIADNYDILSIGNAYNNSGAIRPNASIVWIGQPANDWGLQFTNGVNIKHADCNGDGTINANDTLAVIQNYGLTHNKTGEQRKPARSGIPGLNIVILNDTLLNGDTLIASVQLGTPNEPVSNVYGLAFTYNFDQNVIDTSTISFNFTNSWLGNTDKISLAKKFGGLGTIKTAVTRIDHTNRSGNGEIATFRAIITTDNINGKNLSYYTTSHFISGLLAIDKDENIIELNEGIDSAQIGFVMSGINETRINDVNWSLFPNPTNGIISIKSIENIEGIEVWNVLSERVYTEANINQTVHNLELSDLANGVYIVQIETAKGIGKKRFIVSR